MAAGETQVRLPRCFLCYTPAPRPPPVAPLPAASNGFVTFGSFNALAKITKEVCNFKTLGRRTTCTHCCAGHDGLGFSQSQKEAITLQGFHASCSLQSTC